MKFPLPWIAEFTDLPADEEAVVRAFTLSGTEVEGREPVEGETVLDLGITVNRPDCMSATGLAREASALFRAPLRLPAPRLKEDGPLAGETSSVAVEAADLCPRYRARLILGARVGESPRRVKKRLIQCGLRPINAVVDATNYALLELGHPLHAFDLAKLRGGRIVVRRANPGEKLQTLDGVSRDLSRDMLVIADAERPAALAGIMGGEETGVTVATRDILLEGAVFDPVSIRRTSKALGMHTDASHRFERGVDPEGPVAALDLAASLILEACGGSLCAGALDVCAPPAPPGEVTLRFARLRSILGLEISPSRCGEIFCRLGFEILSMDDQKAVLRVPSFRVDVLREADLIEEVMRVEGLDSLSGTMPGLVDPVGGKPSHLHLEEGLRDSFAAMGYCETIHMSMADPALDGFLKPGIQPLKLQNPLSEQAGVLRTGLSGSLLGAVARNRARGRRRMAIFEIGRSYIPSGEGLPREPRLLAAALYSDDPPKRWAEPPPPGLLDLKGAFAVALDAAGLSPAFQKAERVGLAAGQTLAVLSAGRTIGSIGTAAPDLLEKAGIPSGSLYLGEISLDGLELERRRPSFRPISRFPAVERDFSFILPKAVEWERLEGLLLGLGLDHLAALELVEVYEGPGIPEGSRSWTFSMTFQSHERTLTEEDISPQTLRVKGEITEALRGAQR